MCLLTAALAWNTRLGEWTWQRVFGYWVARLGNGGAYDVLRASLPGGNTHGWHIKARLAARCSRRIVRQTCWHACLACLPQKGKF